MQFVILLPIVIYDSSSLKARSKKLEARREQPDPVKRPFDTTKLQYLLPCMAGLVSTQGDTIIPILKLKSRKIITPKG